MKNVLPVFFLLITHMAFAQPRCGFDVKHDQLMQSSSTYAASVQQMNNQLAQAMQSNAMYNYTANGIVYEIPVVFHVIHTGGAIGSIYNPTDSAILSMLEYMNKVYATTWPAYPDSNSGGVYFPIRFVLAKRNETCGSTSGINRVNGSGVSGYAANGVFLSSVGASEVTVKALSKWRHTDYYNIWIVNKIDGNDGTVGSFTAGYAYFPGADASIDGTIMLATQVYEGASTIVHELGHAFNLYHTFEGDGGGGVCPTNTNCAVNGDRVCDTDPHRRSIGCPSTSTNNPCTSTPLGTLPRNIMDYSSCPNRFTAGQRTRFMSALQTLRPGLASSLGGVPPAGGSPAAAACTTKIYTVNNTNTFNMGPTKVELNDMVSSSHGYADDGFLPYIDRTCQQRAHLISGKTYTLAVTTETNTQKVNVFIDYNNNGVFGAGELVYSHTGSASPEVHSTSYSVPASGVTTCTPLRMRVVTDFVSSTLTTNGCDSLVYGQGEDFSVYIKPASADITLANAITTGGNPSCTGSSLTFTATPSASLTSPTYRWYVNGALVQTGGTTYTSSSLANGANVRAQVNYTTSCGADSVFSNVVVVTRTTSIATDVTIGASTSTTICAGTSVTFTATPVNGGTPSYQWRLNNTNVGTNSNTFTTSTLVNGDVIKVAMTSSLTCATPATDTSNALVMTVNQFFTPAVGISANPGTTICAGTSVTFTAAPLNGAGPSPSYQWRLNGANVGTNSITYTNSTLTNGDQVSVVMTSSVPCPAKLTDTSSILTISTTSILTPVVTIGASPGTTICAGASVTFTATPTNGGSSPSYQWRVNGSNVGTNSPTYITNSLTNGAVVSVIMTSNSPCATPTTDTSNLLTMTVNPVLVPDVTISANPGTVICSGTSVTFTASPTNGGSSPSYQWRVNGVNTGTNSNTFTSSTLISGNVVSVIMTTNAICPSKNADTSNNLTMSVTPTVVPVVTINASPGNSVCTGTPVTFTATPTNGGISPIYQWRLNGSNVGTNSNIYSSSTLATGDVVDVIMTSSAACPNPANDTSNTITMTVNSAGAAEVTISANPGSNVCTGTPVTFTAAPVSGGTAPAYQWKLNGANVGTNSSVYSNSTLNTGDLVSVVMTSNAACLSKTIDTSNIVSMIVNTPVTPSVGVGVFPNDTLCAGTPAIFNASSTNGGSAPVYQWKLNGVNVGNPSAIYVNTTPADGDQVTVTLTSNATCATTNTANGNTITLHVNPTTIPMATITATPGTSVVEGATITFSSITNLLNPVYQWRKNGIPVGSGGSGASYMTNNLATNDTITLLISSPSDSCVKPNSVVSNGLVIKITTGINEINNNAGINLYPNPNNGTFKLSGILANNNKPAQIDVVNTLGAVVYSSTVSTVDNRIEAELNLGHVAPGLYMVRITSEGATSTLRCTIVR
jgi:hypothetical protein